LIGNILLKFLLYLMQAKEIRRINMQVSCSHDIMIMYYFTNIIKAVLLKLSTVLITLNFTFNFQVVWLIWESNSHSFPYPFGGFLPQSPRSVNFRQWNDYLRLGGSVGERRQAIKSKVTIIYYWNINKLMRLRLGCK